MAATFDVDDSAARRPETLGEVEAGREVVPARGPVPVAEVERWAPPDDVDAALPGLRADRTNHRPITVDEIVSWMNEDQR